MLHSMLDDKTILAWPTPIFIHEWQDVAEMNKAMKSIILKKEKLSPGVRESNIGAWHSEHDLLDWDSTKSFDLDQMMDFAIRTVTRTTIQCDKSTSETDLSIVKEAWANICRQGEYHTNHYHSNSMWSGVYYLECEQTSPDINSGQLVFSDPRPGSGMVSLPGAPFGRPIKITPRPGLMVVFPSWLTHSVNVVTEDTARISIAFNCNVTSLSGRRNTLYSAATP